jgi:hypothetical protein
MIILASLSEDAGIIFSFYAHEYKRLIARIKISLWTSFADFYIYTQLYKLCCFFLRLKHFAGWIGSFLCKGKDKALNKEEAEFHDAEKELHI